MRDRISLGFSVGGWNWLDLSPGDGTWLDFSVGMKLIWLLCRWSKLTSFQFRDRNWHGFWVGVEKCLVLVTGLKLACFFCRGIEADLLLEWGLNWLDFSGGVGINFDFRVGDRIWLGFSVGIGVDFFWAGVGIVSVRAEIDLFLVWWSIDSVFVRVVVIDLVFGCGPQIACF